MATIAALGMGLLGSGFAEHMLQLGHTVRVWNRTPSRCAPLAAMGATHADSPAAAVEGADYVHLILAADASVDSVIAQLRPSLPADTPILDHSTNLPAGVAARFAALRAAGVRYLHAPVFMGPSSAREGSGIMMLSGPQDELRALVPYLSTLTGKLVNLGPRPDKAAAVKIVGNSVLLMMTATMGEALTLGAAAGVSGAEVIELFTMFSPTPARMGQRVLDSARAPVSFEASMARKDVGLMIDAAGAEALSLLPAIAAVLDEGIAAGRGGEDFTALFRPPSV
jgi:3-hydroxyisobutyrate dehydrogenase-like beta-hydroxyacid dehydrogenase